MIKNKIKKVLSLGLAGLMVLSIIPSTISAKALDVTEKTKDFTVNTYHFYKFNDADEEFSKGPHKNNPYTPYWRYSKEYTDSQKASARMLEAYSFRTTEGNVTYCLQLGRPSPKGIEMEYTKEELSTALNKVIKMGYPSKSGSAYGVSDVELEWATAVALKITEGNAYTSTGGTVKGLTLEDFTNGTLDMTFSRKYYPPSQLSDADIVKYTEKANRAYDLIKKLVDYGTSDEVILDNIEMTGASDYTVPANNINYIVGPFKADLNSSENSDLYLKITGASSDYNIVDEEGRVITTPSFGQEFYIAGTTTSELNIKVEAFAPNLEIPTRVGYAAPDDVLGSVIDGEGNEYKLPYQKMYVYEEITLVADASVKVKTTPVFNTSITKTDLVTGDPVPGAVIEIKYENGIDVKGSPFTTDNNGNIEIKNLPAGKYYFKETIAPDGYILNEETSEFIIKEDGTVEGKTTLTNKPTEVTITKTDVASGEAIPGAVIEIKDAKGKQITGSPFTTDSNGEIKISKLAAGTYTFKETVAPDGYILSQQESTFTVNKDGSIEGTTTLTNKANTTVLTKTDAVTGKGVAGAVIEITDADGKAITGSPFITNENGQIEISKLKAGTYTFKETIAPDGYILSQEKATFTVKEDGTIEGSTILKNEPTKVVIKKVDSKTDKVLPNATFEIKDKDKNIVATEKTAKDGTITIYNLKAGTYTFKEIKSPDGYILSDKEYTFTINEDGKVVGDTTVSNEQNKVVLSKIDAVDGKPVAGATIEVKNSDGKVVVSGITDEKGLLTFGNIPAGNYTFEETIAPDGYALSKETCQFTVKEDGTVEGTTVLKNTPTKVIITKTDKDSGEKLVGAKYEFRYGNTIVSTEETNKDGEIILNKLPAGKYTFKEVKAPNGYALDNNSYSFIINEDGTIEGTTNVTDSKIIINLYKKDLTTGEVLAGAKFVVKDKDGNKVGEGTTNDKGVITIEKIAAGKYTLQEIEAPKGYSLNSTTYTFTINEDGSVEGDTTIYNKKLPTDTTNNGNNNSNSQGTTETNEKVTTGDTHTSTGMKVLMIGFGVLVAGYGIFSIKKKKNK